jgi:hypothetical protein
MLNPTDSDQAFEQFLVQWKRQTAFAFCFWGVRFQESIAGSERVLPEQCEASDFCRMLRSLVGGIAVAWEHDRVFVIPFRATNQLSLRTLWDECTRLLVSKPEVTLISFDIKSQLKILRACGVPFVRASLEDPQLAWWLCHPDCAECTLDDLQHSRLITDKPTSGPSPLCVQCDVSKAELMFFYAFQAQRT